MNGSFTPVDVLFRSDTVSNIPKLLHIIWVGDKDIPADVNKNISKWRELMPDWNIRIWRNEDINENEFPDCIVDKINLSTKFAQKADIMRYHIIEKYGGIYVDTDNVPHRSLNDILSLGSDIVLWHDNIVTWKYISISFIAAVPHHPILQVACELCKTAEINTADVHLKTGPHLLGTAVSIVGDKSCLILSPRFFDQYSVFAEKFASHTYAASWV
jgi:mannosyltransferase OCH1-like enzyme